MAGQACTLELTPRELALLIKYGLPTDGEAEQPRSSKLRIGMYVAHVGPCWTSTWTADIVRSDRKIRSQNLLEEADALWDVLENAENYDRRVRGPSSGQCVGGTTTCVAADLRTVTQTLESNYANPPAAPPRWSDRGRRSIEPREREAAEGLVIGRTLIPQDADRDRFTEQ
jgi:hypothetical protein